MVDAEPNKPPSVPISKCADYLGMLLAGLLQEDWISNTVGADRMRQGRIVTDCIEKIGITAGSENRVVKVIVKIVDGLEVARLNRSDVATVYLFQPRQ